MEIEQTCPGSEKRNSHPSSTTLNKNQFTNKKKIRLVQWNCHSLNWNKLHYALSHSSELLFLQEVWRPETIVKEQIPQEAFLKLRDQNHAGGSLLWIRNLNYKLSRKVPINQDFDVHRILIDRDKFIWIGSVYLSLGTPSQIKALFKSIYESIPSYEWKFLLLVGDYNVDLRSDLPKKSLLLTLIKQFGLQVKQTHTNTFGTSELDFIIHGSAVEVDPISVNNGPSDHKLIIWEASLPCPETRSKIRVPNKKFAEYTTNYAWTNAKNTKEFLRYIQYSCRAHPQRTIATVKRKAYKKPAIQVLLEADDDCDALEIIRQYFRQFNNELEDRRFSNISKEFFRYVRKVFKYDQIDKRDGSIISSILGENQEIITDPKEVNKQLMLTIKELQVDLRKPQPKNLDFPSLDIKTPMEMKEILNRLWSGKAIAWDSVTDSIFQREWKDHSAIIFADLWKNLKIIKNKHFESRLVPLNKVHPKIPSRKDLRPIVVASPLVKLIETGIMTELSEYLVKKLHPGQTGFVPGNGIFVNIHRVIQRIKLRTTKGQRCYGVFIDFSSAYNTLDHETLFRRLLPIIGETKTQLIKALYSRTKIRLGNETITPNQGVTQGSVLSPALFNIYSEELFQILEAQENVNFEDLLGYADDICVICDSLSQVTKVIECIRSWSGHNNMILNEKKSGIVEFMSRKMKPKLKLDTFQGFPICPSYKYLGLQLTNKLSMLKQLDYIKNKSQLIHQKLSPLLYNSELDTRKSLWQVFIQPLIEFILPLYKWETSISNIQKADTVIRGTLKLFTGLKKNTTNDIVDLLSGYDFPRRSQVTQESPFASGLLRRREKNSNIIFFQKRLKKLLITIN